MTCTIRYTSIYKFGHSWDPQALEMMKENGVPPNTYCMNSVMAVSVQARQPNTALDVFKEMEREGISRDVVSSCSLTSGICNSQHVI